MTRTVPRGVVAVIRAGNAREAALLGRGLARGGIAAVEITFTVPGAESVLATLAEEVSVAVGAGTVRSVEQCRAAARAKASFVVSPDLNPDVIACAHDLGMAAIPGALTPGEVGRCLDAGADAIKVFPVGAVGGAHYIRDLAGPFPGVPWVASGGIVPAEVAEYREAGCVAVCLGRALVDPSALADDDIDAVGAYARRVMGEVPQ